MYKILKNICLYFFCIIIFIRYEPQPRLCDNCLASLAPTGDPSMSGRNFSHDAAWQWTRLDHQGYLDHEPGDLSPYLQIEGWRFETVVYDWMHNLYLGVGRDLFSSGLKLLIRKGVWENVDNDWDTVLAAVHSEMHKSCASWGFLVWISQLCFSFSLGSIPNFPTAWPHQQSCPRRPMNHCSRKCCVCCFSYPVGKKTQLTTIYLRFYLPRKPVLTFAALGGDECSELSSRYKASHVRLMLFWLGRKTQQVADQNQADVSLQILASCCYGLQRATEIQADAGLILEPDEAEEASHGVRLFVFCFAWLALSCGCGMFKVRPKLHYLCHTGSDLKRWRLNQLKLFSTFTEESFLGKVKAIASQCHGKTLSMRVFQRYVLTVAVALHQFKRTMVKD